MSLQQGSVTGPDCHAHGEAEKTLPWSNSVTRSASHRSGAECERATRRGAFIAIRSIPILCSMQDVKASLPCILADLIMEAPELSPPGLAGAIPLEIPLAIHGLIWEYDGVMEGCDRFIREEIIEYEKDQRRESWLLKELRESQESVATFIGSVMVELGVRCATNEFIYLMRSFVKYYKIAGISLLFTAMVHDVHAHGLNDRRVSVDNLIIVEAISAGMEATELTESRCVSGTGCICRSAREDPLGPPLGPPLGSMYYNNLVGLCDA